jgi:hypothetical protein
MKTMCFSALASFLLLTSAFAQNFEITGFGGGQFTGGVDLSTTIFDRVEVDNSATYGVSLGYLLGEHYGVEFEWNHSQADTRLEPRAGGPGVRIFSLNQNQYMGNFLFHFMDREAKLRPYMFFGLGASDRTSRVLPDLLSPSAVARNTTSASILV